MQKQNKIAIALALCFGLLLGLGIGKVTLDKSVPNVEVQEEIMEEKEEVKPAKIINQKVMLYEIVDPNSDPIVLKETVKYFDVTQKDDVSLIAKNMYSVMQKDSEIFPKAKVRIAYIDKNNILHIVFNEEFCENFNGGTFLETVMLKTMTYNFIQIEDVDGVMYSFEDGSLGLHSDFSHVFRDIPEENEFNIIR